VEPTAAEPVMDGGVSFEGGTVIVAVADESAVTDVVVFVPVTRTRSLKPASATTGTYVELVARAMSAHALPVAASQRRHW
jgi:hypothetical protein